MPLSNQFHFGGSAGSAFYDYQIENSVYISKASNSHLYRDFGTPTTDGKWTFSAWVKRGNINYFSTSYSSSATTGSRMKYFGAAGDRGADSSDYAMMGFTEADLSVGNKGDVWQAYYDYPTSNQNLVSNMTFHDTSSWYHVAVVTDVTQASATDRVKAFINGINLDEDGSNSPWGKNTRLVQNDGGSAINTASRHYVGAVSDATATDAGAYYEGFDGLMAEVIFLDGTVDSPIDTLVEFKYGILKPKDPSGLTFGNNGFHLKFANASDLGVDSSGNGNNFTASGLGTNHQFKETPTWEASD